MRTLYINMRRGKYIETVDCFDMSQTSLKEVKRVAGEYNFADNYHRYYISRKCTKAWSKTK